MPISLILGDFRLDIYIVLSYTHQGIFGIRLQQQLYPPKSLGHRVLLLSQHYNVYQSTCHYQITIRILVHYNFHTNNII